MPWSDRNPVREKNTFSLVDSNLPILESHLNDNFCLLENIFTWNRLLSPIESWRDTLRSISWVEIWRRIDESLKCAISIEWDGVEQQVTGLEGEQEWTRKCNLLKPSREISSHNDEWILKLSACLRCNLYEKNYTRISYCTNQMISSQATLTFEWMNSLWLIMGVWGTE